VSYVCQRDIQILRPRALCVSCGQVHYVGGWALEFETFLGPVKLHEPLGECDLGPTKVESSRVQPHENVTCPHETHNARDHKIYRCIHNLMYTSPVFVSQKENAGKIQGPIPPLLNETVLCWRKSANFLMNDCSKNSMPAGRLSNLTTPGS
jgi:hypothetical protein